MTPFVSQYDEYDKDLSLYVWESNPPLAVLAYSLAEAYSLATEDFTVDIAESILATTPTRYDYPCRVPWDLETVKV